MTYLPNNSKRYNERISFWDEFSLPRITIKAQNATKRIPQHIVYATRTPEPLMCVQLFNNKYQPVLQKPLMCVQLFNNKYQKLPSLPASSLRPFLSPSPSPYIPPSLLPPCFPASQHSLLSNCLRISDRGANRAPHCSSNTFSDTDCICVRKRSPFSYNLN